MWIGLHKIEIVCKCWEVCRVSMGSFQLVMHNIKDARIESEYNFLRTCVSIDISLTQTHTHTHIIMAFSSEGWQEQPFMHPEFVCMAAVVFDNNVLMPRFNLQANP
jgi:hypothetical protein